MIYVCSNIYLFNVLFKSSLTLLPSVLSLRIILDEWPPNQAHEITTDGPYKVLLIWCLKATGISDQEDN